MLAVAAADRPAGTPCGRRRARRARRRHGDERVVALELGVGGADGVDERRRRQWCGDRCAMTSASVSEVKTAPSVLRRALERQVVLDDAVDDDVDAVVRVGVRVGVALGDAAVRGPARVADAGGRGVRGGDGRAGAVARARAGDARRAGWRGCRRRARTRSRRRPSTEMPAESYPRYSSFSRPASSRSCACRGRRSRRFRTWVSDPPWTSEGCLWPYGAGFDPSNDPARMRGGHPSDRRSTRRCASHDVDETRADRVGLVLRRRLDHHAHELLGARGADEHAAAALEGGALARDGLGQLAGRHRGVAVGDADVDEPLRQLSIACALGEVAPGERLERQQRGGDAVAGADEAHVDDVAGLLAAERPAALAQLLEHVAVADAVVATSMPAVAIAVWKP